MTSHIVFLPFPTQGHLNPMLMLANLLCNQSAAANSDSHLATFVNTEHNHNLLPPDVASTGYIHFASIPDVVPEPAANNVAVLMRSLNAAKPTFRQLMADLFSGPRKPPSCLVVDGIMSFGIDVAEEFGIPVIVFQTLSATCLWVYFHLTCHGMVPHPPGTGDMDEEITCIPGLEGVLRRRDLPSMCRYGLKNPILDFFVREMNTMRRLSHLIINTVDELECSMISKLSTIFPHIYTIGPLHGLASQIDTNIKQPSTVEKRCMAWLDSKPPNSVIYVSFGSIANITEAEFSEIWHGLVDSGIPFLWAIRRDLILSGDNELPSLGRMLMGLEERAGDTCCIVDWAPQVEVLAHEAVGGFFTHSGWNSIMESIWAGVPVVCWPKMADQYVNSRVVRDFFRI
ncbi:7-deoxyloganetic acid glucosyltransferase [Linum perenne]